MFIRKQIIKKDILEPKVNIYVYICILEKIIIMTKHQCLLKIAAIFATFDVIFNYVLGSIFVMKFLETSEQILIITTSFIFLYSLIFGSCLSLIPRRELRGKNRHEMMKTQGGHTVMLAYFIGLCVVAEVVRQMRDKGGSIEKIKKAINLHIFGVSLVKFVAFGNVLLQSRITSQFIYIKLCLLWTICTVISLLLIVCLLPSKKKV